MSTVCSRKDAEWRPVSRGDLGTRVGGETEPGKACSQQDPQREPRPWGGNDRVSGRPTEGCGRRGREEGSRGPWVPAASGPGAGTACQALSVAEAELQSGKCGLQARPGSAPLTQVSALPRSWACSGAPALAPPPSPSQDRQSHARFPAQGRFALSPRRTPSPQEGAALHTQGSVPQASPSPALESASADPASNPTLIPCPQDSASSGHLSEPHSRA